MPSILTGGVGQEGRITAQELTGHWSTSGEQLHCAPLALCSLILLVLLLSYYYYQYHCFSFLSVLLNCLYLNSRGFFPDFLPHPRGGGGVSKQLRGA